MKIKFWKLSQGTQYFDSAAVLDSIHNRLVYVHKDTKAKGRSARSQAQDFIEAPLGDYFYLTYGNNGVYLLGQFSGAANLFSSKGAGWLDRPFRQIRSSRLIQRYSGENKWWSPSHDSTFTSVPEADFALFEQHILKPYFGITLSDFGV